MKIKSVPIGHVKAGPDDGLGDGEFLVYPSTFTRDPDAYGDVVAKGAFAETIQRWKGSGNVLPGLYGHRMDDPDYFVASATDMGEDDQGWWVKGAFDLDSPKGNQVYRLVKGRRLSQLSFAYDVLEEGKVELGEGQSANELRKLHVHEFSFVPVGANQHTSVVAVKALADSVAHDIKGGQALAREHIDSLRAAQEAIGAIIKAAGGNNDQEKASDQAEVKPDASDQTREGESSVSGEEPKSEEPVDAVLAVISIREKG